jgi:hypothetical protein
MGGTSRIVTANIQGSAPVPHRTRHRTIIAPRLANRITPSSVPRR